ncbi:MAG TPA: hypothetical protein PLJ33_07310 [Peptococcaceae bacterium]|jgi:hypothetical protein|nr:hypothetical protein [Clostridia bacterium]HOB81733.1 hypothetical protein [Peptococcaceae bacterium]HPZ71546.1 hypothetical protein [Peptococcaceae bacterium]HQD54643.1 hypothetical protein [Peptococcaceae bacterium]
MKKCKPAAEKFPLISARPFHELIGIIRQKQGDIQQIGIQAQLFNAFLISRISRSNNCRCGSLIMGK